MEQNNKKYNIMFLKQLATSISVFIFKTAK